MWSKYIVYVDWYFDVYVRFVLFYAVNTTNY